MSLAYISGAIRSWWSLCLTIPVLLGGTIGSTHAQTPTKAQTAIIQAERTAAEALYLALLAEMQLLSEQPGTAYSLMLEAARKSADPDTYKRAINIALQNRAGTAALDAAYAWAKAYPQSTEALRTLLQLQLTLQKIEASGEVLSNLLKHTPDTELPDLWVALGQSYGKAEKAELAISVLEKQFRPWFDKSEQAAGAWAALGRVQLAAKQEKAALASLQKALSHVIPLHADSVGLLVGELLQAVPEQVEGILQQHLNQSMPDATVRMAYIRHLIGTEKIQAALPHLQVLTAQQPRVPEPWLLKGLVEHQLNRHTDASKSLQQFLEIVDADPDLAKNLSRGVTQALLMLAQMAESRKDLTQADIWLARIKDGEEMLSVQSRKASLLMKQGKIDAALALIQAIPEKQGSENRSKLLTKIQLLRDNGQLERAYALLDTAHLQQSDDADLLYEQAMIADKLNRFQDMERLLRIILEKNPDYHHALNALGYALADRNERLVEAKELIEKALALAPGDPFITDSLGWVKFRLGRLDDAESLLRQAFAKRADAEIAIHLAEVLWKKGALDDAKSMFRQAKELQADHPALMPTMQRLGVQW